MRGFEQLRTLTQFAPYQLFRFAMDWNQQVKESDLTKAVVEWEKRESGSLKGVLDAYTYIVTFLNERPTARLSIDVIESIYKLCMPKLSDIFLGSAVRHGRQVQFHLTKENTTKNGLLELIQETRESEVPLNRWFIDLSLSDEENLAGLMPRLRETGFLKIEYLGYDGPLTDTELDAIHIGTNDTALKSKHQQYITQEINRVLDLFYNEIFKLSSENKSAILSSIVKLIQRLERIHPFYDGNCRTFCMVMLNTLLIQHDFPLTLMDDPNKFDGYSVDELVQLVKEGMDRTRELVDVAQTQARSSHASTFFSATSANVTDKSQITTTAFKWTDVPEILIPKCLEYAKSLSEVLRIDISNSYKSTSYNC